MQEEINRIDILEKNLARLLQWINGIDAKMSAILAIDTSMLAILAAVTAQLKAWTGLMTIYVLVIFILLLVTLVCLCCATFPQTRGPLSSLLFFEGIVHKKKEEDYLSEIQKVSYERYLEDLARQCYRNAEIASSKYRYIKYALIFLFVSIIPWLLLMYILLI